MLKRMERVVVDKNISLPLTWQEMADRGLNQRDIVTLFHYLRAR